jgi:2-polyprenyl-3-methyl-5-hydroxy-6-metoxy-1,4-benzoquinol methylase
MICNIFHIISINKKKVIIMAENRLKIIAVENNQTALRSGLNGHLTPQTRRQEAQARFDRLWLLDPKQFDPNRNSMERERLNNTLNLILHHLNVNEKRVVDLGCGSGVFSRKLASQGSFVDAVDVSSNALKELQKEETLHINPIQDYVPVTTLKDEHYDLVISTELIALLPHELYRLYFSELARLVKPEGYAVSSTALDIDSEDALARFSSLMETEFEIQGRVFSYHRFTIKLLNFFKSPFRFTQAAKEPEYRHRELASRTGISRWWFSINSTSIGSVPWYILKYLCYPFVYLLSQNRISLIILEKFCQVCCGDSGISHVIYIGKRKPIFYPPPPANPPRELKHKKQVWE